MKILYYIKKKKYFIPFVVISFFLLVLSMFLIPIGKQETDKSKLYKALKADKLAKEFSPIIYKGEYEAPESLFYRAAIDKKGYIYLAYHYVWKYEKNTAPGIGPFLSRIFYTGGLHLQRIIFGKNDVEVIAIKINPILRTIVSVTYETAEQYSSSKFAVKHKKIEELIDNKYLKKLYFKVISWNHLFIRIDENSDENFEPVILEPVYFSKNKWYEFSMSKLWESPLRKNRAQFSFEKYCVE